MTTEQMLLDFRKEKENIRRITTAIIPVSHIHPEARRRQVADTIRRKEYHAFEVDGVQGLVTSKEDALTVAATIANYRFLAKNSLLSDMAAGLYSMATTGAGLYDVAEIKVRDQVTGLRIICSPEAIRKASFGPLVTDNGRAIDKAGAIVKENWFRILDMLEGRTPVPRAYASVYRTLPTGEEVKAVIGGYPVTIHRIVSGSKITAVAIDLDSFFFPIKAEGGGHTVAAQYVRIVAGLTSFLQLGKSLIDHEQKAMVKARAKEDPYFRSEEAGIVSRFGHRSPFRDPAEMEAAIKADPKRWGQVPRDGLKEFRDFDVLGPAPNALTARKIILVGQAAFSLLSFAPGIFKETGAGRGDIIIRRNAVQDLYPPAFDTATGRYRFLAFSRAVAASGEYFLEAMKHTGIEKELAALGDIMIPAVYRGAEFPDNPNQVFLKVDYLSKALP